MRHPGQAWQRIASWTPPVAGKLLLRAQRGPSPDWGVAHIGPRAQRQHGPRVSRRPYERNTLAMASADTTALRELHCLALSWAFQMLRVGRA
eukprot:13241195-Alexandrium_andersonii.AAC.1